LAGLGGQARQVGYALHALADDQEVPWQRVINAQGEISLRGDNNNDRLQRMLLEGEGIRFDRKGRIDLERYRWRPRGRAK
jgi:methylated-DNA-protein-cysteine methyltransferase-like protein